MKQKFFLTICLAIWFTFAIPEPAPTTAAVPAGLTPADWAQIQSQLSPQAVTAWNQQAKLTASDAAPTDFLGYAVAVDGDTAVVGALQDDDGGMDSGAAYVFTRSGTSWIQQAKLTASDASAHNSFGLSVAISGDTAVIGAFMSAYVFVRSEESWSQQAKLTASDISADDWFGISVAISGDTALVGSRWDDDGGSASGSAYAFVRSGEVWSQQAKFIAGDSAANNNFGISVAISNDTAVIGAYGNSDAGSNSGAAYVFARSGTSWSQQAKLTASDASANDWFGLSVAVSGDTAVIGTPYHDDGSTDSGSAYVFTRSGTSWSQQAKLTASDGNMSSFFGRSVAISGDTAVMGAYGDGGTNSGSAYVFTHSGTAWSQQAKLTANDAGAGDNLGWSVAISGDTAVMGAYGDDDGGTDTGSVYVFSTQAQTGYVVYLPLLETPPAK